MVTDKVPRNYDLSWQQQRRYRKGKGCKGRTLSITASRMLPSRRQPPNVKVALPPFTHYRCPASRFDRPPTAQIIAGGVRGRQEGNASGPDDRKVDAAPGEKILQHCTPTRSPCTCLLSSSRKSSQITAYSNVAPKGTPKPVQQNAYLEGIAP